MNKHSPAPWLFRGKSSAVYSAPPVGSAYTYGTHYFSFRDDAEPSCADLALILAAPELLEAARDLLASVVREHGAHGCEGWPDVIAARAAIAKATGSAA